MNLQPDGDFLFVPGGLQTAAHPRIPLLPVMCNNRSYGNDEEHQEVMAKARGRPVGNKVIGIRWARGWETVYYDTLQRLAQLGDTVSLDGQPLEIPQPLRS